MGRVVTGYDAGVTDAPDDQPTPVEQLRDHLDEVRAKPDQMQERLDELEESIEATRRQAEADDLLPGPEANPMRNEVGIPEGDESSESPASDTEDSGAP